MIRTQLSTCSLLYVSWLFHWDMKLFFNPHRVPHVLKNYLLKQLNKLPRAAGGNEDVIEGNTSSPCRIMEHLLLVLESSQHVVKILNRICWTFNFNIFLRMRAHLIPISAHLLGRACSKCGHEKVASPLEITL